MHPKRWILSIYYGYPDIDSHPNIIPAPSTLPRFATLSLTSSTP